MNQYEELIYSLIANCNREITKEEKKILNQASAIYNTYNNLTDELGCPLDVREQALTKDFIWYDDNSHLIQVIPMNSGYIMEKGKKTAVLNCIYNFNLWLMIKCKDYKKTWWLRKDKTE